MEVLIVRHHNVPNNVLAMVLATNGFSNAHAPRVGLGKHAIKKTALLNVSMAGACLAPVFATNVGPEIGAKSLCARRTAMDMVHVLTIPTAFATATGLVQDVRAHPSA